MKKGLISLMIGLVINPLLSAQTKDSLDIMIGQMIMIGLGDFNRLEENRPVFNEIRAGMAGGVILFEKNLSPKNTEQNLSKILKYAQSQSEIPLFISIDEEGGRVNRLKPKYGFHDTPTAQWLGDQDNPDTTRYFAQQTASLLYRLGINMNFAPDVDVNVNPSNPVIGSLGRSFSEDPLKVATHARQVIESHDQFGVVTVLKHFPGHGSSRNDSHLGMADVSATWQVQELYPYKALMDSGKVRAIMTAHIINDAIDDEKLPATLSNKSINGLLRNFMGYQGVVISDDMQMGAISKEYGLEDAIKMSINAGVDILLFANNVPDYNLITAAQIHGIIKKFVINGDISITRIKESYKRIINLKNLTGLK